jgi:hypothetical protein
VPETKYMKTSKHKHKIMQTKIQKINYEAIKEYQNLKIWFNWLLVNMILEQTSGQE